MRFLLVLILIFGFVVFAYWMLNSPPTLQPVELKTVLPSRSDCASLLTRTGMLLFFPEWNRVWSRYVPQVIRVVVCAGGF